ncbi:MAG: hypothetical protein EHM65_10300, partial [Acidobacteriales bacterium]
MVSSSDIRRLDGEIDSLRESMRWLPERVYALEHPSGGVLERPPVKPVERPAPTVPVAPAREVTAEPIERRPAP